MPRLKRKKWTLWMMEELLVKPQKEMRQREKERLRAAREAHVRKSDGGPSPVAPKDSDDK